MSPFVRSLRLVARHSLVGVSRDICVFRDVPRSDSYRLNQRPLARVLDLARLPAARGGIVLMVRCMFSQPGNELGDQPE